MFANASCKGDGVEASHYGSVRADVLADAVRVDRNGAAAILIAVSGALLNGREVAGAA